MWGASPPPATRMKAAMPRFGRVGLARMSRKSGGRRSEPDIRNEGILRVIPRPQIAHLPAAGGGAASLALQPRLAAVADIAGEKIAAGDPVRSIDGAERGDGAAGAGMRI